MSANPQHSAGKQDRRHLGQLDALRGAAVLVVMLLHCAVLYGKQFMNVAFLGQRGVQLFL